MATQRSQYRITKKAGKWIAGRRNRGVGEVLELSEMEARYELELGTIEPVGKGGGKKAAAKPVDDPAEKPADEQAAAGNAS